ERAERDRPAVELQPEPALREAAVGRVDGGNAVQLEADLGAPGPDLVDIPPSARLVDRLHRGHVDEASRAVLRIGIAVPDLRLVSTGRGTDRGRIHRAQVDAAVRLLAGPEFGVQLEVAERSLRHEHARALG